MKPVIHVRILEGPGAGIVLRQSGSRVTLGRSSSNDLQVPDERVSGRHGELLLRRGVLVYRDLDSRHGTVAVIEGERVRLHRESAEREVEGSPLYLHLGGALIEAFVQADGAEDEEDERATLDRVVRRQTAGMAAVERFLDEAQTGLRSVILLARTTALTASQEDILAALAKAVFDGFGSARRLTVVLRQDGKAGEQRFVTAFERGGAEGLFGKVVAPRVPSETLVRSVMASGEALLYLKELSAMEPTRSLLAAQIEAAIVVPMSGPDRLCGIAMLENLSGRGMFAPEDVDHFSVLATMATLALERAALSDAMRRMLESIVHLSVSAIDARDPSTAGHSHRVTRYTLALAEAINLEGGRFEGVSWDEVAMRELRYACLLHDFGKIAVREQILMKAGRLHPAAFESIMGRIECARVAAQRDAARHDQEILEVLELLDEVEALVRKLQRGGRLRTEDRAKLDGYAQIRWLDSRGATQPLLREDELHELRIPSGTLTEDEFRHVASHALQSERLLAQIPWTPDLAKIPLWAGAHHEKLDGSGYPHGLQGDAIPIEVRMMTIADIYDAVTAADRPYRPAASQEQASGLLRAMADEGKLDPDLVEIFLRKVLKMTH